MDDHILDQEGIERLALQLTAQHFDDLGLQLVKTISDLAQGRSTQQPQSETLSIEGRLTAYLLQRQKRQGDHAELNAEDQKGLYDLLLKNANDARQFSYRAGSPDRVGMRNRYRAALHVVETTDKPLSSHQRTFYLVHQHLAELTERLANVSAAHSGNLAADMEIPVDGDPDERLLQRVNYVDAKLATRFVGYLARMTNVEVLSYAIAAFGAPGISAETFPTKVPLPELLSTLGIVHPFTDISKQQYDFVHVRAVPVAVAVDSTLFAMRNACSFLYKQSPTGGFALDASVNGSVLAVSIQPSQAYTTPTENTSYNPFVAQRGQFRTRAERARVALEPLGGKLEFDTSSLYAPVFRITLPL